MSKTKELIKLLKQRAQNPGNPYPYMAGYLENLVYQFEQEYKSAEYVIEKCINDLKNRE
jgi:hypothetical protein